MKLTSSTMARSDSEDVYEVTDGATLTKLQNLEVDDTLLDKPNDTTIHSGHFMVSHVHDEPPDEGEEAETGENSVGFELEVVSPGQSPSGGGGGCGHPVPGCRSSSSLLIDESLTKLFECMTLAHCKLTSPKWRNFRGINVRLKDKIRLNNIIWREWHMQYIKGISPIVCHFETPVSSKNESELDSWKLRLDSLTRDYKRLSRFFAHRFSTQPDDHELLTRLPSSYYELLQRASQSSASKMANQSLITVPMFPVNDSITMDDEAINDIFDTLFTPYPPSRGNMYNLNMQSNMEEFMDTLEPLPPPLAVDFRGFGRLSSSSVTSTKMPSGSGGQCGSNQTSQQMPSVSSQPLSFGSAEEIIALLQSQLTSESSLECLMTDPASVISSSGYSSGATVRSGFTLSDGSLVSAEGASMPMLPSDGIDMQEYPGNEASQLCSMFFLPETTSLPIQSLSMFTSGDGTSIITCDPLQSLQLNSTCMMESSLPLQELFRNASSVETAMSSLAPSRALPQGSASLPRMKSSHDLSEFNKGSLSLGSLQSNEASRGFPNSKQPTTDAASRPPPSKFRAPQNTGARVLPPLQPRPQEIQQAKQGASLLPKPIVQQPVSTNDWSVVMPTTGHLAVPLTTEQYALRQDARTDGSTTTRGYLTTEAKNRVRHKSDQSAASKGTSIRPIAVFQPINPLQTSTGSGRSSSKPSCSVSFSLDKNTTISPTPIDSSMIQVTDLSNNIILATSANVASLSTSGADSMGKKTFGENLSCPGIFETSSQSCDFGDALSLNGLSARSRHTSNESTSSHYDEFSVRNSKPQTESRKQSKELRRVSHITAEQKRRCNIKCGFDTLISLIPDLKDSSNSRVSKANALHKAAELCKKMKQERTQKLEEAEQLRNEIKALEVDISACQSKLPATGAPPIKQPVEQLNSRYEHHFFKRTLENWKYFIFGITIAQPLLKSFEEEVCRGSCDQLRKSVLSWVQNHCSLASLRPRVTNALVDLSKQTSILSNPSLVPEEVKEAVLRQRNGLQ